MKKDPVKAFGVMVIILGVMVAVLPIISVFEKKQTPEWFIYGL